MTYIREPELKTPLDSAAIRLRALEVVAEYWQGVIGTTEALEVAKGYAQWIEHGEQSAADG